MDTQEQKYCAKACFTVLKTSPEQSSFQLTVESNFHLLWCCLTLLAVGKKKTAPLSQPIKSATKTNPDTLTIVLCLA